MHKLLLHPAVPGRIYQQNHVGVYRSDDYGDTWYALHKGLPYDFGFGLALDPNDAETCFVVPLEPRQYMFRATPGHFRVYKRKGRGWTTLDKGLPKPHAYQSVKREAMSNDSLKPGGVYVGTGSGHIFASRDAGRSWKTIAEFLPPVLSVEASVL